MTFRSCQESSKCQDYTLFTTSFSLSQLYDSCQSLPEPINSSSHHPQDKPKKPNHQLPSPILFSIRPTISHFLHLLPVSLTNENLLKLQKFMYLPALTKKLNKQTATNPRNFEDIFFNPESSLTFTFELLSQLICHLHSMHLLFVSFHLFPPYLLLIPWHEPSNSNRTFPSNWLRAYTHFYSNCMEVELIVKF